MTQIREHGTRLTAAILTRLQDQLRTIDTTNLTHLADRWATLDGPTARTARHLIEAELEWRHIATRAAAEQPTMPPSTPDDPFPVPWPTTPWPAGPTATPVLDLGDLPALFPPAEVVLSARAAALAETYPVGLPVRILGSDWRGTVGTTPLGPGVPNVRYCLTTPDGGTHILIHRRGAMVCVTWHTGTDAPTGPRWAVADDLTPDLPPAAATLTHRPGHMPTCCICDPATCAADDTGDHCNERSCGVCLHGCPAGIGQRCCIDGQVA